MHLWLALALALSPPLTVANQHLNAGQLDELPFDLGDDAKVPPEEIPIAAKVLAIGAKAAWKKGDTSLAMQLAQTARRRDPKLTEALQILAEVSLHDRSFTDAEAYGDTLGNLLPKDAHIALLRARIALAEEDWNQAATLSEPLASGRGLTSDEAGEAKSLHAKAVAQIAEQHQGDKAAEQADQLHAAAQIAAAERAESFRAADVVPGKPIVVYGTTWCGYCKKAREYFQQHHLAFEDKDVERDPDAAKELQEKEQIAGIHSNGVPVLDVRGTIIQGFNVGAIESALHLAGG